MSVYLLAGSPLLLPALLAAAAAGAKESLWKVTHGACLTDGSCVSSPNFPKDYDEGTCTFHPHAEDGESFDIYPTSFRTEEGYDELLIDGNEFSGSMGEVSESFSALVVDGSTKFRWNPDSSDSQAGWRICAEPRKERPGEECYSDTKSLGPHGLWKCEGNQRCTWCGGRTWYCCKASGRHDYESPCSAADYAGSGDGYQCAKLTHTQCVLDAERPLRTTFEEIIGAAWSGSLWSYYIEVGLTTEGAIYHPQTVLRSKPFIVTDTTRISVVTTGTCPSKQGGELRQLGTNAIVNGIATEDGFVGIALQDVASSRWVAHRSRSCELGPSEDRFEKLTVSTTDLSGFVGKVMTLDIIDASSSGYISAYLPWQNFLGNGSTCQMETWDSAVRLTNGSSNLSGILEIFHSGRWRAVAYSPDDHYALHDYLANAACAELGLDAESPDVEVTAEAGDAWLEAVPCKGPWVRSIWECVRSDSGRPEWGNVNDGARPVKVACKERAPPPDNLPWDVVEGPCERRGTCITSPGFPEPYPSSEKCIVRIYRSEGLPLMVAHFDTEAGIDLLSVDDNVYRGSRDRDRSKPPNHTLTAMHEIRWDPDDEDERNGWRLCTDFYVEVAAADVSGEGESFVLNATAWQQMLGEEPKPGSSYRILQERAAGGTWRGEVRLEEDSVSRANGAATGQWEAGDRVSLTHEMACPCKFPFTHHSSGREHMSCFMGEYNDAPWCALESGAPWTCEQDEFASARCPMESTATSTTTMHVFTKCMQTFGCYSDNELCSSLHSKASDCLDSQEHSAGTSCRKRDSPSFARFAASRLPPFFITLAVLLLFLLLYRADEVWRRRQQSESRRAVDNATAQSLAVAVGRHFLPSQSVNTHQFRGMRPAEASVAIKFEELGLGLRDGRNVLEGVSGEFKATHLVAIMGPSGAGKTTFMNVLAGRATYGTMTGQVWFNGTEVDPVKLRPSFGFVPQDDVVHSRLTVRENLLFSAWLRNPRGTPREVINEIVDDALAVLQIGHVQSSLVGSVEERGISGGQRKRVNIGWELVACPSLLFLDEPTSGLDSTTSLQIINSLQKMTELNMTICMVIHQPRYQLFTLFDDVLLLGPGGRTVYLGPSQRTVSYFEGLGYQMPDRENAADWFMDVLSGCEPHPTLPEFKPTLLFEKWKEKGPSFTSQLLPRRTTTQMEENLIVESALQEEWSKVDTDNSGHLDKQELVLLLERCGVRDPEQAAVADLLRRISSDGERVLFSELLAYIIGMTSVVAVDQEAQRSESMHSRGRSDGSPRSPTAQTQDDSSAGTALLDTAERSGGAGARAAESSRQRPTALLQFGVLLLRRMVQFFRENRQRAVDLGLMAMCACVVGALHQGSMHTDSREYASNLATFHMGLALLTAVSCLKVFGADRTTFWRESGSGMNVLSYMLAKVVGNVFDLLFQCSLYSLVYFYIVKPEGAYVVYWLPCLVMSLLAASWGYFISAVLPPQNAMTATVISILILCGVLGNPAELPDRLGENHIFMEIVVMISISRWSMPLTFLPEMNQARATGKCRDGSLEDLSGSLSSAALPLDSVVMLLLMSIGLHVACYLGLRFMNRDKQV